MTTNLTPELKKQLDDESKEYATMFKYGKEYRQNAHFDGAKSYALKWQEAEQRAERHEKALRDIKGKAMDGIFPSIPIENMGAQMCIEIEKIATEALTPKQTTDDKANG